MIGWDICYTGSIERAVGTKSFRFDKPGELEFSPGQFAFFTIPAPTGERMRHHFTISASPTEPFVEFTTRMTGSPYKTVLEHMQPSCAVRMEGVAGRFGPQESMGKVLFLAGGIGITPGRSAVRWAADTGSELDIAIVYANRDEAAIAFRGELDELSGPLLKVVHVLEAPAVDWTGPVGRITDDVVREHIPDWAERHVFVSGPPAMVQAMEAMLRDEVGVSKDLLSVEHFTGY